jgi:four helix bundle protein
MILVIHDGSPGHTERRGDEANGMKYRQFEDLPVWKDSADLARRMYEFSSLNQFTRHPGLRDQLERAALSVSNNIAEGFERGSTNELLAFLYIARGSAGEVRSMLKVLDDWSDFSNLKSHISDLISKSENISRQLYGWMESLKRSGISGQRHLDEKARTRYSTKRSRQEFLEELDRINLTEAEKRQTTRKPT